MKDKIYKRKKEAAWRDIGGDIVVMDIDGMMIRGLNKSAAFIWEQIDGQKSTGEIARALADEFSIDPEEAYQDTVDFLKSLVEKNLIT